MDKSGNPHQRCRLELFYGDSQEVYDWRETESEILVYFVVNPRQENYYRVSIQCATAREVFKSSPILLGGKPVTLLDLGDVVIPRILAPP